MKIKIQNAEMNYRGNEVSNVLVLYRIEQSEENLSGTGRVDIESKNYQGSIDSLKDECREHFIDSIDELKYEIRSTNMQYKKNEVESVQVIFRANLDDREISVRGNFDVGADEYNEDPSVGALEEFAKDYIKKEAEKED